MKTMRVHFDRLGRMAILCLAATVLASFARPVLPPRVDYAGDLINAVLKADRVVIDEHSTKSDTRTHEEGDSYRDVTYRTLELTADQKQKFVTILERLPTAVQDAYSTCVFAPHHTIRFYRASNLHSTMVICFECGQVRWDGTKQAELWSLYDGLREFVAVIGMRNKADWYAVAHASGAIR